ncbi:autism susceptibility gene 2 protein homolog isoform X4 [Polypterus senegalus]|uniref:autism susceptibility gene 2 protein homolog isoform X4 n=1 Tax=Polypterus senegalus TaxID=55291 RepID=UPI00196371A8|nr:autism susceptibility gene 2 protein homolog isoform X4 [Polypterus senegalus]
MDAKMRQSRRSRSQRDRVRRREAAGRDAHNQSPSSGSDRERSPGTERAAHDGSLAAPARTPRPPRRKRRESSSQEEDIIDGFAIASFITLDSLQKDLALKPQDRKEKWQKHAIKRRREPEYEVASELAENGRNNEHGSSEREQERGKERMKSKVMQKKSAQRTGSFTWTGGHSEDELNQDLKGTAERSSPKDHLSESSTHSLSGRGYSCDSESDIDDKASDVGSEKLFSPASSKGRNLNESLESTTASSTKVSGLQRSQEQSAEVPFAPPVTTPTPASPNIGSTAPTASAVLPPSARISSPAPPVKESQPQSAPPSPQLIAQSLPQPELRAPPIQAPSYPPAIHQVHHQTQYNGHNNISRSSSASSNTSVSLPKQHLPHSPLHSALPPPALPLSIANLATSHYSLRPPAHHHPAMFATPASLPPPPALANNSLVVPGHPAGAAYPEHDLLRQELNNRFLVQSSERSGAAVHTPLAPVSLLRAEFHQHQHTHQHRHTHQHTFTPFPGSRPSNPMIGPPSAPSMVRSLAQNFDKYTSKLDNPFLRHSSFFPSYPPPMSGMAPLLPHSAPFSSLQGAFQPKASNPIDVASRPGGVPHTLLQKDPRVSDPYRTSVRKPGKWCAVHVQIAWQIYHHQQKMKQMQLDPHKLDMNGKLDLFSRPPGPGLFPGLPYPHDLARPLFPATGAGHPAASPYGPPSHHHSSFLATGHLADPYNRSSAYSGLGNLTSSAFGGLGNPSLTSNSVFGPKESHGLSGFSSPHHDTWNRLHRTPPSFPTPPQWPKSTDNERSSSVTNHDREKEREREREREKRESLSKEDRDKDRDTQDKSRTSNRSSPASAPVGYQISNLIRSSSIERTREGEKESVERLRETSLSTDIKVKESHSPGKEVHERRQPEDMSKPCLQPPSPYGKPILTEPTLKITSTAGKDGDTKSRQSPSAELLHKVKNDVKVKEERKEEQEVMLVSSEPATAATQQHHPTAHQPPSRCTDLPSPASLHSVHLPHSMPLSLSGVNQVNSFNLLDRTRVAPFMGISPLSSTRERLPHPGFTWDPLRDAYRSLDLHRRMDYQLRAEQSHRFPGIYEHERSYREREPHDYSHHEHLLEARREHERLRQAEERERMHIRDELDRARLHQLHQSPIEGHLPHMPPFMSPLGSMHYPRLSPSAAHNGMLNRTPPTAALSAPPPLVPTGSTRPTSPRRTTPLASSEPREYSPTHNPKEVEAR